MLNLLPIQFLAPLTFLLLRVVLGLLLIRIGSRKCRTDSEGRSIVGGSFHILVGILLFIGLFTQAAALMSAFIAIAALIPFLIRFNLTTLSKTSAVLVLAISLTLFITGAGPFAFDLPI